MHKFRLNSQNVNFWEQIRNHDTIKIKHEYVDIRKTLTA